MKVISFSKEMVKAIISGKKTQTRRPIDPALMTVMQGRDYRTGEIRIDDKGKVWYHADGHEIPAIAKPGDIVWVREPWVAWANLDQHKPLEIVDQLSPVHEYIHYLADDQEPNIECGRYRQTRFMPMAMSRITLEVVAVRIEMLGQISNKDAIAEGVESFMHKQPGREFPELRYKDYSEILKNGCTYPALSFNTLWHSIYDGTKKEDSQFCWVIEFKVVRSPAML